MATKLSVLREVEGLLSNMNTRIVVLAAGKGTRMHADIPKVLTLLGGKPIIQYLLDEINVAQIDSRPIIVIGYKGEVVQKTLGNHYEYVLQKEQLGTGNAVQCAESVAKAADNVIVLYGDHPFLK